MATIATRYGLTDVTVSGLAAGILLGAFEIVSYAALMGAGAALMPLRMAGAIVLGPSALNPGYPLLIAAGTGIVVHLALSVFFAAIFALVGLEISRITLGELLSTPGSLAAAGVLFGILLWLVNFYGVAPVAGWTWFPMRSQAPVEFIGHAVFYGAAMGWLLARTHERHVNS